MKIPTGTPEAVSKQYYEAWQILGPLEGETPLETARRANRTSEGRFNALKAIAFALELNVDEVEYPTDCVSVIKQLKARRYVADAERVDHASNLTEHQYWQMVADAAFAKQIRKCVTDANRAVAEP